MVPIVRVRSRRDGTGHIATSRRGAARGLFRRSCAPHVAALIYNYMVVNSGPIVDDPEQRIDRLFHALADPTRRDILRRAMDGEPSVSILARAYPMSFAAVQKHVAVLARAGLVSKSPRGREQLVRTDIDALRRVRHALDELEALWRDRIDRFAEVLAEPTEGAEQ